MSDDKQNGATPWTSFQVYALSAICLLVGVTAGYLFRASGSSQAPANGQPPVAQAQMPAGTPMNGAQVTPEQLKQMADKKAEPLLEELRKNPNDPEALTKVGTYYFAAKQFGEAAGYFEKAANVKPTADSLTKLANAQYYAGSGEQAIATLNRALKLDPKFANALYNLGMLRWEVQGDVAGAIASWEKLLKTNPNHPNRAQVEKMIARAKQHQNMPAAAKTDKPAS